MIEWIVTGFIMWTILVAAIGHIFGHRKGLSEAQRFISNELNKGKQNE